jgi:hypothetical protein
VSGAVGTYGREEKCTQGFGWKKYDVRAQSWLSGSRQDLVNAVMNLQVPYNPGNFLDWETILEPKSEPRESTFKSP